MHQNRRPLETPRQGAGEIGHHHRIEPFGHVGERRAVAALQRLQRTGERTGFRQGEPRRLGLRGGSFGLGFGHRVGVFELMGK